MEFFREKYTIYNMMILLFTLLVLVVCIVAWKYNAATMYPGPVVVVGNGPSLMGKGLGHKIDKFPNVIRVNKFRIKGYERDVGSRTTGWHVNENLGLDFINGKIKEEKLNLKWMGSRKTHRLIWNFPHMERYSFKTKVNGCKNFTSGTLVILHMLEKGYGPVYVAGISGSSGAYYFDQTPSTIDRNKRNIAKTHCEDEEQMLIRDLIKSGKVVRLD